MMLRYCSLHERRWSFTRQCWIPFPQARMQDIHAYAARLRATDPAAPALTVRDTGCDVCATTLGPLAQSRGAPNGLHRSEP
jgi:hypothetical protein